MLRRRLWLAVIALRDGGPLPLTLALLLVTAVLMWRGHVQPHEAMYLLGPRRIVDPALLAGDLTWSVLPPTTFLYDHLLALLLRHLDDLAVMAIGRAVFWALLAGALASLTRLLRVPAWAAVGGYALWLLCGQTLAACGRPVEGFQPKALAYPLFFFSLLWAARGQVLRAGAAAGLGTVFHIIVGGWGCLSVFCSMLLSRRFSRRQLVLFLAATAPFIAPLLLAVARHNVGDTTAAERALMDRIYVTFAEPHCCDPSVFLTSKGALATVLTLTLAPLLLYLRTAGDNGRIVAHFVAVTAALYGAGLLAHLASGYGFLKLYPFQLANSLPLLFLFLLALAGLGGDRPRRGGGAAAWAGALACCAWLVYDNHPMQELRALPGQLRYRATEPHCSTSYANKWAPLELYHWIRTRTPKDSVFVTPHLDEFWVLAERAQVASMRHPPLDRRLIEWERRLIALHGDAPFEERGFEIKRSLGREEGRLTVPQLQQLRDRYGATHYLTKRERPDLERYRLFSSEQFFVYGLGELRP